jgi:hypothetical protein
MYFYKYKRTNTNSTTKLDPVYIYWLMMYKLYNMYAYV